VLLHVYDLGHEAKVKRINRVSNALGGGLYHTAIEVVELTEGNEWSYGHVEYGTGVFKCQARGNEQHSYRETASLGRTKLSSRQLATMITQLQKEWQGEKYHLVSRNCQCFCEEMALLLGVSPLPDWIRRFARIGEAFVKLMPSKAEGRTPALRRLGPTPQRTQAAIDGITLLKRKGVQAVKFDRCGVPRLATFRLSEDETRLCWDGRLLSKSIELSDVVELLVGLESAIFQRTSLRVPPAEHLSLSLILKASLPAPPSADTVESRGWQRQSVDISIGNEEEFGLWVAALRTLIRELQELAAGNLEATRALEGLQPHFKGGQPYRVVNC